MRRFEASPRRAAPKGHETFISRTASLLENRSYMQLPFMFRTHDKGKRGGGRGGSRPGQGVMVGLVVGPTMLDKGAGFAPCSPTARRPGTPLVLRAASQPPAAGSAEASATAVTCTDPSRTLPLPPSSAAADHHTPGSTAEPSRQPHTSDHHPRPRLRHQGRSEPRALRVLRRLLQPPPHPETGSATSARSSTRRSTTPTRPRPNK
jgi:hypothetical protein